MRCTQFILIALAAFPALTLAAPAPAPQICGRDSGSDSGTGSPDPICCKCNNFASTPVAPL
ncbi:hypothetical protein AURDEDRAFT_160311 [Auricularia subglabra TFB-10046 SS5]|nr:hypothetical protein AURDEDRAFT_160311 [Auricularia subglabra TFB-10046 SS5]